MSRAGVAGGLVGALVLLGVGVRRLVLVGALVAAALGVGDVAAPEDRALPALEVVVAVDRTTSMTATDDPAGSRLAAARADVLRLADALPTARFSVVAFGARAEVELPPTTDREALDDELAALSAEAPTTGVGSALARPVPLLGGLLRARPPGGTATGAPPGDEDVRQVLVVLTDGEDTAPGPAGSWAVLARGVDAALVLGYGTADGGRMPLPDGGLVTDPATGAPALSRRDDAALARVADQLGGGFRPRTGSDADPTLDAAAERLRGAAYADLAPPSPGRQVAWAWGLLVLLLALLELRLGWRRWLEAGHEGRLGRAARRAGAGP